MCVYLCVRECACGCVGVCLYRRTDLDGFSFIVCVIYTAIYCILQVNTVPGVASGILSYLLPVIHPSHQDDLNVDGSMVEFNIPP